MLHEIESILKKKGINEVPAVRARQSRTIDLSNLTYQIQKLKVHGTNMALPQKDQ
jgi:hypothetical protein